MFLGMYSVCSFVNRGGWTGMPGLSSVRRAYTYFSSGWTFIPHS